MATFQNYATLSYLGTSRVSNLVTGEIVSNLRLTKTAVTACYVPGGQITYAISILNSGSAELTGLQLTDDLGAYDFGSAVLTPLSYLEGSLSFFVNGVLQTPPTVSVGTGLTVQGISVPGSGNAMILYAATANEYAPPCSGGQIQNTVSLTGGGLAEAITAEAVVTPDCGAELSITKAVSPASVTENGEITYTFLINNTGGEAAGAEAGVTVSDTFDPILKNPTVQLNGSPLTPLQYSYNAADGSFSTNAGVVTVPGAVFSQDPVSGVWTGTPGVATLTVSGTI